MPKFKYKDLTFDKATHLIRYLSLDETVAKYWLSNKSGDVTEYLNGRIAEHEKKNKYLEAFSDFFGEKFNTLNEVVYYLKTNHDISFRALTRVLGNDNVLDFIILAFRNNHLYLLRGKESFVYDGVEFNNTMAFYAHYSIEPVSFRYKYLETNGNLGDSLKLADFRDYSKKKVSFEVGGRKFETSRELTDFYGINNVTFLNRYNRGEEVEDIIKHLQSLDKIEYKKVNNIVYNGILYKSKAELVTGLKIHHETINNFLDKSKTEDEFVALLDDYLKNRQPTLTDIPFNEEMSMKDFLRDNQIYAQFLDVFSDSELDLITFSERVKEHYLNNYITIGDMRFYTSNSLVSHFQNGFLRYIFKYLDTSKLPSDSSSKDLRFLIQRANELNGFYKELGGVGESSLEELSKLLKSNYKVVADTSFSLSSWNEVKSVLLSGSYNRNKVSTNPLD